MTTAQVAEADVQEASTQEDAQRIELEARTERGDFRTPSDTPAAPEQPEREAGGDAEQNPEAAQGGQAIPRARFNEVNDQRKEYLRQLEAAQRELAALRGQAAPTAAADVAAPEAQPTVDEDALEEEYAEALLDGDSKRAAAIRRQIKDHQAVVTIQQYEALQHQRASSQLDAQTINSILDEHKWLDTDTGAEALELIVASAQAKMQAGMPRHQALQEATKLIAPRFAPNDPPSRVLPGAQPRTDTRLVASMQRNAADAMAQPTAVQAGIGNRSQAGKVDVDNLTDEEYAALPAAERKKLRGD